MSEVCQITGLTEDNVAKLSYLHKHLTEGSEIPIPDEKSLNGFIKPLENTVSSNRIHNSEQKRKDGLLKHLEKSIASKFEGAKLSPFGSAESGLSLREEILICAYKSRTLTKRKPSNESVEC
ncbi:MAG: hypothetical protein CM15mP71_2960 [Candidatus Poseidoniales archaeon]|nr:MAG: hypothetical protein CM15mP71_2960 [Candidatus Poseidoniales archaeon]